MQKEEEEGERGRENRKWGEKKGIGDGRTIEPAFLMAELLNKLKIKGNAYSQFLSRYSEEHSVRKDFINLDGQGNFENLDTEQREKFDNVEYYQQLKNWDFVGVVLFENSSFLM